jgi:hypothetical protein
MLNANRSACEILTQIREIVAKMADNRKESIEMIRTKIMTIEELGDPTDSKWDTMWEMWMDVIQDDENAGLDEVLEAYVAKRTMEIVMGQSNSGVITEDMLSFGLAVALTNSVRRGWKE